MMTSDCQFKKYVVDALKYEVSCHPLGIHQIADCTEAQPGWINSERGQCNAESKRMPRVCMCVCVHQGGAQGERHRGLGSSRPMTTSQHSTLD